MSVTHDSGYGECGCERDEDCDFDHPHPTHPCGREIIEGITTCPYCGNIDSSPECHCWIRATGAHLAELELEAAMNAASRDLGVGDGGKQQ